VASLLGLPRPQAAQTSLPPLEGKGLEGKEQEKEPIFRCRQGAVLVHGQRAVRGCPSRRHPAIGAGNAAAKGGLRLGNSSSVSLIRARYSVGRAGASEPYGMLDSPVCLHHHMHQSYGWQTDL
jgi:hypothetical protein